MYYKINIDRLPNKLIKWSVLFGNDNNSDTDSQLIIGVAKEFIGRLEALEQMNHPEKIQSKFSEHPDLEGKIDFFLYRRDVER